ncbi:MAG: DUF1330 domain-containing protein [Flavobacteriales bacterium]|nr:DUF1330 domain-containing protein [Flavobacteriales bacterium]
MKKGYIIENYSVIDKENYIPPVKVINEILEKYKGKFLVATPKAEVVSGVPNEVTIVIEFDSTENARAFYHSEDYSEFQKLYNKTTKGWIVISEEYHKK